jgi:AraC-like DNA-binding protein
VIRQIIECPYDASTSTFYFDIKIREIFLALLQQVYKKEKLNYAFSEYEVARLVEARNKLLEDLGRKPFTISELSRTVGLNVFKLKVGFRQLFGVGVFECLQDTRMEKAREMLLKTNKPIKEISALSGYPRMTNFITAFRKRFGYTPGSLRRS